MIGFNQKAWLKNIYIIYEYEFKKSSKNDFEKDFFKLMNNNSWGNHGKCEKTYRY